MSLPPIGTSLVFLEHKGIVISHEASTPDWPAGVIAFWPTLRYEKKKGVNVFPAWPSLFVTVVREKKTAA